METTSAASPEAVLTLLAGRPDLSSGEVADATGIGHSTAAKRLAALEQAGEIRRHPGGRDGRRRLPDRWSIVKAPPAIAVSPDPDAGHERLGRGELDKLVLAELAAHPDEPLGPAGIAKRIGRSSGAIANALDRLASSSQVVLVATSPRRYQLAIPGVVTPSGVMPASPRHPSTSELVSEFLNDPAVRQTATHAGTEPGGRPRSDDRRLTRTSDYPAFTPRLLQNSSTQESVRPWPHLGDLWSKRGVTLGA